jgi:hypothetical protein
MKKILLSATIALFAVTAFAQSNNGKNKDRVNKELASDRVKDKAEKDRSEKVRKEKDRTEDYRTENNKYDVNNDGIFSPEEKEARKADKMARKEARNGERDLADDGLLNGSSTKDNHGRDVSGTARGTEYEGREKGKAVSDVARSNGKSREGMQGGKPARVGKPAGAGAGRKMK